MSGGRYIFEARIQAWSNFSLDITLSFISSFVHYRETRRAIARQWTGGREGSGEEAAEARAEKTVDEQPPSPPRRRYFI